MHELHLATVLTIALGGCTSDKVSSDEQAKEAYVALDMSIGKSLELGFEGFNTASSANISPQMTTGATGGTLVITGQVDQGQSANKQMRLYVGMVGYGDGKVTVDGNDVTITYDTSADMLSQPYLQLSLAGIPTGTLTGSLVGTYTMSGDLKSDVTLNLMFSGTLEAAPNNTTVRTPGTTMVTGTATSGDGTYNVMVTL